MSYEAWRISFQSSEQAARAAFSELQEHRLNREAEAALCRGQNRVLAELLLDAVAVVRTIDHEDAAEGKQLEALIDRAEKAARTILTPN